MFSFVKLFLNRQDQIFINNLYLSIKTQYPLTILQYLYQKLDYVNLKNNKRESIDM